MSKVKDETGNRYGRLLVIKRVPSDGRGAMWLCKCDCGNEAVVYGTSLRGKRTTSCKCKSGEWNKLPKGEAASNNLLTIYKRGAERRNLDWNISKEQFKELTQQDCYYCGSKPNAYFSGFGSRYNGGYTYNGIDREDNNKGYTVDNAVSCCKICNYMKRDMSKEEFLSHIRKILLHSEDD